MEGFNKFMVDQDVIGVTWFPDSSETVNRDIGSLFQQLHGCT